MDPALRELLRTTASPGREVEVLVRLRRPGIDVPGVRFVSRFGEVATGRVAVESLVEVHDRPDVVSLKAGRRLSAEAEPLARRLPTQRRRRAVRPERGEPGARLTGAGVVVGAVDWGLDVDHPNFKNADGTTRVLALWDQRDVDGGDSPAPFGYGRVFDRHVIDRALSGPHPYRDMQLHPAIADRGAGAHGSHVMDIVAGNGANGGPVGVAPEAELVFVHLADRDTGGLADLGDSVRLLEAVDFVMRAAGDRPCVVNLSVGTTGGAHDGTGLVDRALDELLTSAPGRMVVQSVGNYYEARTHASGRLGAGESRTLTMERARDDAAAEMEVWYGGSETFSVSIDAPGTHGAPAVHLGDVGDIVAEGRVVGQLYHRACDPNNRANHIDAFLFPGAPPGRWRVTLRALVATSGTFDAWIERSDGCAGCQVRFVRADADPRCTTGTIANGHVPIVVGAFDESSDVAAVAPFSSSGPTRDGRSKPDVLAAGVRVLAARSASRGDERSGALLVRKSGTSMASPRVAGAVALCLQAEGRALDAAAIRELVLSTASPSDGPPDRVGCGYLDLAALTSAVRRALPSYAGSLEEAATMTSEIDASGACQLPANPDRVYREVLYNPDGPLSRRIAGAFDVLGRPGEPVDVAARPGDVILEVVLGARRGGACWVVGSPELVRQRCSDRSGPAGWYSTAEAPDGTMQLRHLFDPWGSLPPGRLWLRPRPPEEDGAPQPSEDTPPTGPPVPTGSSVDTVADVRAGIRLLEARLDLLARRYPPTRLGIGAAIGTARQEVAALRAASPLEPALATTVSTALRMLEWVDYDLGLIEVQRTRLVADKAPVGSLDFLVARYARVLIRLVRSDVADAYALAQESAERLPVDILLEALKAHGELNRELLKPSQVLVDWVDDLHARIDALYLRRGAMLARPGDATIRRQVRDQAAFIEVAVRAIQLHAQYLVVFEQFLRNRPGVMDTPLVDAMNRIADRVRALKEAYDAGDLSLLRRRTEALESDQAVKDFYRALPAAMQVTSMVGRLGVTLLVSLATGGVGGLVGGGARAAATGTITISVRSVTMFLGTAVLEAATFTVLNSAASALIFGDRISFGSMLMDFAWNVGMFTVLRTVSGVSAVTLRAAELELLTVPVQMATAYPYAQAWGVMRFRVENGRWPTPEELDRMDAESLLLLAGTAVGSRTVSRWLAARRTASQLSLLQREHGWRFQALESLRTELAERVRRAEAAGKGNDTAELTAARAQAQRLEESLRDLLTQIVKDRRFTVTKLREEFTAMRSVARDLASELLTSALGVPADAGARRAAPASYTYANGRTSPLEDALAGRYRVTKTTDPRSGLRTVTASRQGAPTLAFAERSAGGLDFDPRSFDLVRLAAELSLTTQGSQRMLLRLLSDNGITRDSKGAITATRRQVKGLSESTKKTAQAALDQLSAVGRLHSTARPPLVQAAEILDRAGIRQSPEWLDARTSENRRGVVGEWQTLQEAPGPAGRRALRRVTVQAALFEDAAGARPVTDANGVARANATAAEADVLHVRDAGTSLEVDALVSVKTSAAPGEARSAARQNDAMKAVLSAAPGALVPLTLEGKVRYARVLAISGLDGTTPVVLTGRLRVGSTLTTETVGPKGVKGYTRSLTLDTKALTTVGDLLFETQLLSSGDY